MDDLLFIPNPIFILCDLILTRLFRLGIFIASATILVLLGYLSYQQGAVSNTILTLTLAAGLVFSEFEIPKITNLGIQDHLPITHSPCQCNSWHRIYFFPGKPNFSTQQRNFREYFLDFGDFVFRNDRYWDNFS